MPLIIVLSDGETYDLLEYTEVVKVTDEELDRIERGEKIEYVLRDREEQ